MNPSDLVPQLPLPAWGYGRYGTTVELPGYASTRFASSLALMQQAYQANTGLLDSYSPDALEPVSYTHLWFGQAQVLGEVVADHLPRGSFEPGAFLVRVRGQLRGGGEAVREGGHGVEAGDFLGGCLLYTSIA